VKGIAVVKEIDLGQIFTKRFLADYMVGLFSLPARSTVLDPCFGKGVFLDSLRENTDYITYGYEIDKSLFDSYSALINKSDKLCNSDFLCCSHSQKYDGIIMNPPYIRHEKIDDLKFFGITKDKLREQALYAELPKTANMHMYFIVKALDLLKESGELIVIFPGSWFKARSGEEFQKVIQKQSAIEKRIHVIGDAFSRTALVDVVILKLIKTNSKISFSDCKPTYIDIENGFIKEKIIGAIDLAKANTVSINAYAKIRRGLTTGSNNIFVNPRISFDKNAACLTEILSSPKSVRGYSTCCAKTDKLLIVNKKTEISKELSEYLSECESAIMKNDNPKTIAAKIRAGDCWYYIEKFDCRGIIFGYIVRQDMRFIYNDSDMMIRDNFYIITPLMDACILLCLLNNYYVYVQLELSGKRYGGGMLKLQKYDISSLILSDIDKISNDDKQTLRQLGQSLTKTSDRTIIDKITLLLSKYHEVDYTAIAQQYNYLISVRLEYKS
jgi:tRNA1(Val) A37 N6-methylase TrmN6